MRAVPGGRSDLPGLQAERTSLAWERTAVALFANGALLLLRHAGHQGPAALVAAGVALLASAAVAVLGLRRARRIRRADEVATPARRSVALVGGAVIVVGAAIAVIETGRLVAAV